MSDVPAVLQTVGTALVSGAFGFLGAFAVFRSRLDVADERFKNFKEEIAREQRHNDEMLDVTLARMKEMIEKSCKDSDEAFKRMERRQLVTLEVAAHVARKLGVANRALGVDGLSAIIEEADKE